MGTYRNVQPYPVIAILNQNCFSIVLSSFLSYLSFSTSSPFPTGSSFFFLCYDRRRENWSKKRLCCNSFKKTTHWDGTWLTKPKSHCSNPSNMRCCVCSAAGIKLLFRKIWVEICNCCPPKRQTGKYGLWIWSTKTLGKFPLATILCTCPTPEFGM